MMYLSPSKIATYKLCPFKYKCESNLLIRKAYKKDHPETTFGNLIHASLTDYFQLPEEKRNFDEIRNIFKGKFMKNYIKHVQIFKNQTIINNYVEEAKKQFRVFINSSLASGKIFEMKEKLLKWTINDNLLFMGLVDRVDYYGQDLIIIDYKTGRLRDEYSEDREFQVDCYQYLISKKHPAFRVAKKILFFLKEDKMLEFQPTNLDTIESKIIDFADIIRKDISLLPRKNKLCSYCDYKMICPIYQNN